MSLSNLKKICSTFSEEQCINIEDRSRAIIGSMFPFSSRILCDDSIVSSMTEWRFANKKMFPTQVMPTKESTVQFLSKIIEDDTSVLFGIFDKNGNFVGHIGLIQRSEDVCELAHLIRGINTGESKLIMHAEASLLNWCFRQLGASSITVELMSYNWIVMLLHNELGFALTHTSPLLKVVEGDAVYHRNVSQEDSNVKYGIAHLRLGRDEFYSKATWFVAKA